jgi:hypothetical protein
MSMVRIVVGTFAGVILAVVVLYAGFTYLQWRSSRAYFAPPPSDAANFQDKMLQQGYWREHSTQRWYPLWQIVGNRCQLISGSTADATLQCIKPLTGGIPDEK